MAAAAVRHLLRRSAGPSPPRTRLGSSAGTSHGCHSGGLVMSRTAATASVTEPQRRETLPRHKLGKVLWEPKREATATKKLMQDGMHVR